MPPQVRHLSLISCQDLHFTYILFATLEFSSFLYFTLLKGKVELSQQAFIEHLTMCRALCK